MLLPGHDPGRSAVLSPCGRYRYVLRRAAAPAGRGVVNFILLNPSTADAEVDDPTVRRCVGFARDWGCAEMVITNLFALRSTDPRALVAAEDPEGPDNDAHLLEQARAADWVVCGWGARGNLAGRDQAVLRMLTWAGVVPHYLKLTGDGAPGHPLYLSGDLTPKPMTLD